MSWKNLTIGKKISSGFGIIIILLVILGTLSFTGVGRIVKNATDVIKGKALDGELAQKEVDHLNWIGEVNKLLTDETVNELTVQTDHTKCGFGKWLYGDGREQAEALIPTLALLFKAMEEPHKHLHESAIEIGTVYSACDPNLPGFIANKLNDHLEWAAEIQKALLDNEESINVQTDPKLCAFGKWLYSAEAATTASADSIMGTLLEQIKTPHQKLHDSAKEIQSSYRKIHEGLSSTLHIRLDDHRRWTAQVAGSIIENSLIQVETDPGKCGFGKWLESDEVAALMASDTKIKDLLTRVQQPHHALHKTAVEINAAIQDGNLESAKKIFTSETEKQLAQISELFEQLIRYEGSLVAARENAVHIFKNSSIPALAETKEFLKKLQQRAQEMISGRLKAYDIYANKTAPNLKTVQTILGQLREEVKKNMMTDQAMLAAATSTKRNVAIIAGIAIIASILLAFIIARGILYVLSRITDGMSEGADQVASAAGQVSSSSQSMAEGASQQAASIEETSSSMEEMASMTKKNAENAGLADNLMKEANQVIITANKSMEQLSLSMADISRASEATSKIIKTIDEIAFQTNLLALNAAVEAARAGEAGAGFAVVADEVRNLAMRAADAAKNTATLIEGTVKKVNDGSKLVATTNDAFTQVAESSTKVGNLVSEIAEASKEQSTGIEQVNLAITEMDKVVQQNAANAEESAAASEEMNAQAEQLKDYVGELVMMVKGSNDQTVRTGKNRSVKAISHPLHSSESRQKKLLTHRTKEIRPDQIIPFDDEDEFKDF